MQKLTLFSDTFIWIKHDTGLLYNSKTFVSNEFVITSGTSRICLILLDINNLYSTEVDLTIMPEDERNFINMITSRGYGVINDINEKIVSFPPLLNIQNEIERSLKDKNLNLGEGILKYFTSLTIYTGGDTGNSDNKKYYHQILYPILSDKKFDNNDITAIIKKFSTQYLRVINIVTENLESIIDLKFTNLFSTTDDKDIYVLTLLQNIKDIGILDVFYKQGVKLKIICDNLEENINKLNKILIKEKNSQNHFSYCFIIRSIEEYEFVISLIKNKNITNYDTFPVYDNNLSFFEENVFLLKPDLKESKLCRREIFLHQAINSNDFGKLTIMPDKNIYSNINFPPLGTIENNIYELIQKELIINYSWRRIRDCYPCNECIWQWICPSPSNYEIVMKKNNLCH